MLQGTPLRWNLLQGRAGAVRTRRRARPRFRREAPRRSLQRERSGPYMPATGIGAASDGKPRGPWVQGGRANCFNGLEQDCPIRDKEHVVTIPEHRPLRRACPEAKSPSQRAPAGSRLDGMDRLLRGLRPPCGENAPGVVHGDLIMIANRFYLTSSVRCTVAPAGHSCRDDARHCRRIMTGI